MACEIIFFGALGICALAVMLGGMSDTGGLVLGGLIGLVLLAIGLWFGDMEMKKEAISKGVATWDYAPDPDPAKKGEITLQFIWKSPTK